jgi:DNA-binding MarR family transcriptional regulator
MARGEAAETVNDDGIALARFIRIAQFRADLRTFLRHNERACREWGLTPQRYQLLLAIKGAPDGSQRLSFTELAERLQLSRNTVTELCARAEDAGLLTREPSETDQRVIYLRLTPDAERRIAGVVRESDGRRRELERAFEDLSETFRRAKPGRRRTPSS